MAYRIKFSEDSEEAKLVMELSTIPSFPSIDAAEDWALENLPRGCGIEVYDGRKSLRASGYVGVRIIRDKPIKLLE